MDMLPTIAAMYFAGKFGAKNEGDDVQEKGVKLSAAQSAILLALGLQRKTIEDVEVCASQSST